MSFESWVIVVAVFVLVVLDVVVLVRLRRTEECVRSDIYDSFHEAFQIEMREMAQAYEEELKLAHWIEELAKEGKLDLTKLAQETEARAYALALKKAEDVLKTAESNLLYLEREITAERTNLAERIRANAPMLAQVGEKNVAALCEQRDEALRRVEDARTRLQALTSVKST